MSRAYHSRWRPLRRAALVAAALVAVACDEVESLRGPERSFTPHERYAESLREAGLAETALGREWVAAGRAALNRPVPATPPFREAGYFPADEPTAFGFRFEATRGQRLTATVELEGAEPTRVFLELFSIPADTTRGPEYLESADSTGTRLEWEPRRTGEYVLRIQPELLRSGRFVVTVQGGPALAFPVDGRDSRAIQSYFGADRDGGSRSHHGVDIFAPRGTPVRAAAAGVVSRVDTTPRGGRVVWLRDAERGQSLYYAHLDSQTVVAGMRVRPGDTLGLVGNTGNARSTPPHLHFGIYRRGEGPIDPLPWVRESRRSAPALAADVERLGRWGRVAAGSQRLRAAPVESAAALAELPRHTAVRVVGASDSWYRVALPDGRSGYLAARSVEPVTEPLRQERLDRGAALLDQPSSMAAVIDNLAADADYSVLGTFREFLLVEAPGGRTAWLVAN